MWLAFRVVQIEGTPASQETFDFILVSICLEFKKGEFIRVKPAWVFLGQSFDEALALLLAHVPAVHTVCQAFDQFEGG